MGITFDDEHAPGPRPHRTEIAPAARARARCQCDKARAGGRSDCRAAASASRAPARVPLQAADFIGELLGLHRHAIKCSVWRADGDGVRQERPF